MTVTYLPHTHDISDEAVKQNFEYLESHGLFLDDNLASIANKTTAIDNLGALDAAENLADLASIATALTNLGLPDATGKAPFLQLLSTQKLRLDFGLATLTWPGASPISTALAVNHGLGVGPQVMYALPFQSAGNNLSVLACTATSTTTVTFQARTGDGSSPAAASTLRIAWMVLG